MFNRDLGIALLISISIHVLVMSSVVITTPEDPGRKRPYSRVDFLGPILHKTAFDIMLENVNPAVMTTYRSSFRIPKNVYLNAVAPRRNFGRRALPELLEKDMDRSIMNLLVENKEVPELYADLNGAAQFPGLWDTSADEEGTYRKVIYKPEQPFIIRGHYGDKEVFRMRMRVSISPDGKVYAAEPLTTTGYAQLDMFASKYVKSWLFDPRKAPGNLHEGHEVNVLLKVSD